MTKAEIIQWMNDYNKSIEDVSLFAQELVDNVKKLNYVASNGGRVIGYAGSLDGNIAGLTGLYKTANIISEQSGEKLCFINYSAENILNDDDFWDALIKKVGVNDANKIVNGNGYNTDSRSKYSFPESKIPALNDLVSEKFMNPNAKGDVVLLIAENARIDSVLAVTEIPQLMNNSNVKSILGVQKK